jgi:hypothetical protein
MTVLQSRKLRTPRKKNTINSPMKDNKCNLNSVQLNILRNCVSSHRLHQRQLAPEIFRLFTLCPRTLVPCSLSPWAVCSLSLKAIFS